MNKERERQAVEDLRRLDANFPAGVIEEHEVPDFIVRAELSCLGIEVTEYFRPERRPIKWSYLDVSGRITGTNSSNTLH